MTLVSIAQQFAQAICTAHSPDHLYQALVQASSDMGFGLFALSHHPAARDRPERSIRLHNYPERWEEFYDRNSFGRSDPIYRASYVTSVGFEWSAVPRMVALTHQDMIILERGRDHGLRTGYTVPSHIPGERSGSCSFVSTTEHVLSSEQKFTAQLVGGLAFECARRLDGTRPEPIAVPTLTDRQVDCVLWAAKGKTDWETAHILGISHETVIQHLKLARDRYDVRCRAQLIVRALYDGLISFGDVLKR